LLSYLLTHMWVDVTHHNSNLPQLVVKTQNICRTETRTNIVWFDLHCVLFGGRGIYLHSYTAKEQTLGFKKFTIKLKPLSEEFKVFNLCAENLSKNKQYLNRLLPCDY
uniref:PDZ and pleckstrin homology domains 1 n=1 Tax=Electrophorus electricus TaxID=8005 RepID=A0A4W4H0D4_ELEEL